jgi:hypothetical protein
VLSCSLFGIIPVVDNTNGTTLYYTILCYIILSTTSTTVMMMAMMMIRGILNIVLIFFENGVWPELVCIQLKCETPELSSPISMQDPPY